MKERPTSISVIAWFLIGMGGISLIVTTFMITNPIVHDLMSKSSPIPIPVQYAISYVGIVITIVSGIAMLKGCNWARFLYIIWNIVGFLIMITTSSMKAAMIPSLVFFLIVTFFLFRPKANAFFSPVEEPGDA
jgi:hypothetical protein